MTVNAIKPEDLIPKIPPAYGQETAQVILDIITHFPQLHDQSWWGVPGSCGTAHCVAGWARTIHANDFMYTFDSRAGEIALGINRQEGLILFSGEIGNERARHALEYLAKGERIPWRDIWPEASWIIDLHG